MGNKQSAPSTPAPCPNAVDDIGLYSESEDTFWEHDKPKSEEEIRTIHRWTPDKLRIQLESRGFQGAADCLEQVGLNGNLLFKLSEMLRKEHGKDSKKEDFVKLLGEEAARLGKEKELASQINKLEDTFVDFVKSIRRKKFAACVVDTSERNMDDRQLEDQDDRRGLNVRVGVAQKGLAANLKEDGQTFTQTQKLKKCFTAIEVKKFEEYTFVEGDKLVFSSNKDSLERFRNKEPKIDGEVRHAILGDGVWDPFNTLDDKDFKYESIPPEVQFLEKQKGGQDRKFTVAIARCKKDNYELIFCASDVKPLIEDFEKLKDPVRTKDEFAYLATFRNRFLWKLKFDEGLWATVGDVYDGSDVEKQTDAIATKKKLLREMSSLLLPLKALDIQKKDGKFFLFVSVHKDEKIMQEKWREVSENGLKLASFNCTLNASDFKPTNVGNYGNYHNKQYREIINKKESFGKKGTYVYLTFRQHKRKLDEEVVQAIKNSCESRNFFAVARNWTNEENWEKGFKLRAMNIKKVC